MKEIIVYSAAGTLGFALMSSAMLWLLSKAEACRNLETQVQPASGAMGAAFQLEPSGD